MAQPCRSIDCSTGLCTQELCRSTEAELRLPGPHSSHHQYGWPNRFPASNRRWLSRGQSELGRSKYKHYRRRGHQLLRQSWPVHQYGHDNLHAWKMRNGYRCCNRILMLLVRPLSTRAGNFREALKILSHLSSRRTPGPSALHLSVRKTLGPRVRRGDDGSRGALKSLQQDRGPSPRSEQGLDLFCLLGYGCGQYLVAVAGHRDVVFDPNTNAPPTLGDARIGRWDIDARLDGDDHARLEQARLTINTIIAHIVHIQA